MNLIYKSFLYISKKCDIQISFWLVSCISISLLSYFYNSSPSNEILFIYLVGNVFYVLISYLLLRKQEPLKNISYLTFTILALPVIFLEPVLENDHFRYLAEAKAILNGIDPYLSAPKDYANILIGYIDIKKIGFTHLTSPYPALNHLFHMPFALFSYPIGIILLRLFYLGLCLYLFKRINWKYLICFYPFFLKEFIQGAHIDLLAASVAFLPLSYRYHKVFAPIFSFGFKIIGLLPAFLYLRKKHLLVVLLASSLFLIPFINAYLQIPAEKIGLLAFGKTWEWAPNPIFYLFTYQSEAYFVFKNVMLLLQFSIPVLLLISFRKKPSFFILSIAYLLFFWFSAVINSWYFIWFLLPAMLAKKRGFLIFAILHPLLYLVHLGPSYYLPVSLILHLGIAITAILSLSDLRRSKYINNFIHQKFRL